MMLLFRKLWFLFQQYVWEGRARKQQDVELLSIQSDGGVLRQADVGAAAHRHQSVMACSDLLRRQVSTLLHETGDKGQESVTFLIYRNK